MALVTFVATGAACTDIGAPFFIVQNTIPGEGCSVAASTTDFRARGIIDANASGGYVFTPVVQSTAEVEVGTSEDLRIVFVEGADIDIDVPPNWPAATDSSLLSFSKRFSGAVQPGGLTAFAFTIIPEEVLAGAAGFDTLFELGVTITMFGSFAGSETTAQPYTYWVDVCDGCMKRNVGACESLPSDFEASTGGECVLLQDVPLDCCTQADSTELCPATPSAGGV